MLRIKRVLFPSALLLNLCLLLLSLTYSIPDLNVFPWLMAAAHILLFLLNMKAGCSWLRLTLLSGIHIAATWYTHQFYTLMYFTRILGSLDGRKWAMGLCLIDTAWTIVLFLISLIIFGIRVRRTTKRSV